MYLQGGYVVRSHRLELMRQIYNMNEGACAEEEAPAPPAPPTAPAGLAPPDDLLQCISTCANNTRLSLANLLPSRLVREKQTSAWRPRGDLTSLY